MPTTIGGWLPFAVWKLPKWATWTFEAVGLFGLEATGGVAIATADVTTAAVETAELDTMEDAVGVATAAELVAATAVEEVAGVDGRELLSAWLAHDVTTVAVDVDMTFASVSPSPF